MGRITILVATGFHRPCEGKELEELIGDRWILENISVVNHDALADADHVYLGNTKRAIPVKIDRRFVQADLRIVTGLVEPHFMAGYSGGRKVIAPGICHADTICGLHSARLLEHPSATNCVLDANPLHEEQVEIVRMLGGSFAVNVVIDELRRVSFINSGEIVASHLEAVEFLQRYSVVPLQERFDTVVTSAAGYPLDKTYYQTVKGMLGALSILKPGGDLFIVSECSEGMGSPEYIEAQTDLVRLGADGFRRMLLSKPRPRKDEWQVEMQLKAMMAGSICLYSTGLTEYELKLTGIASTRSLADSLARNVQRTGSNRVAVVPEGPYVIPVCIGC